MSLISHMDPERLELVKKMSTITLEEISQQLEIPADTLRVMTDKGQFIRPVDVVISPEEGVNDVIIFNKNDYIS